MGLFQGFKNFTVGAARILAPIGESVGSALAVSDAKKLEMDTLKREMDLQDSIQRQIRRTNDPDKKARLLQIAQNSTENKGIISQVEAFHEKPMQTFAKGAITAANITLLSGAPKIGLPSGKLVSRATAKQAPHLLPFLQTKAAADFIAGSGGVQKVTRAMKIQRGAKIALKDFGIGAGFGTLFALEQGEKDKKKMTEDAAILGGISMVAPPIIGRTLGVTGRAIGGGAKTLNKYFGKGLTALERYSELPVFNPTNQLDDFINIAHNRKQKPVMKKAAEEVAKAGRVVESLPGRFRTIVTDRMAGIKDMAKEVSEVLGRPVSFVDDPYKQARRTSTIVNDRFRKETKLLFTSIVNDFSDVELEAQGYLAAKNSLDRIKLGNPVVRGKTQAEIEEAIKVAEGLPNFKRIQEYEALIQTVRDRVMAIRKETGLVDDNLINLLQETHPNYSPNKVLDFFDEGGTTFGQLVGTTPEKFNVTGSGIQKAKGSERELMNPVEAWVVELKKAITDAERNRVANMVIDLGKQAPELGYSALRTAENVKARKELIGELVEVIEAGKSQVKELKREAKFNKELGNKIQGLESSLAKQEEDLRLLVGEFFEDESILKGVVREKQMAVTKIPTQLEKQAKAAREFDKFEEFASTKEANEIVRKVQSGEMESFGFKGDEDGALKRFYEAARGDVTPAKTSVAVTDKVSAAELGKKQKEVTKLGRAIEDMKELDKTSSDDAVNFLSDTIQILNEEKARIRFELADLADTKIKEVDLNKEGLTKVSRYIDGVREDWVVPKDVGAAMKNLDSVEIPTIVKFLGIPADLLKMGATRFNLDFIFRNPARDIQTAKVVSKTGLSGTDWVKILLQSKGKNAELLNMAEREGALLSGLFDAGKSSTPKKILKELDNTITIKKVVEEYNPFAIMEKVGEKLENNTRLAVFKGGIDQGLSPAEAAFNARNASVDFNKMGTGMAVVNKLVPFLNARVQGFINTGSALKSDPTKFVREQMWTAIYPTMLLNSHNNKFESFKYMDQRTRDQNWVVMMGEEDGVDEAGNPIKIPNAIKIPKGEAQQPVANVFDHFLDFTNERDTRSYQELLGDIIEGTSPVTGMSSVGPLTAPMELKTNFDLFREKAIVPDYISVGGKSFDSDDLENKYKHTKYTSETAKRIGQQFDIAPVQVDFINNKLFGGLGPTIFKSLDIAEEGFRPKVGTKAGSELSTFEKMAQLPVLKGFLTTSNYGAYLKDLEIAQDVSKELANPEFVERQRGEVVWKTLKAMDREEANAEWFDIKKEDPVMYQILNDIWESEKDQLNSTDRIANRMKVGNGERALFLVEQFNLIEDREGKDAMWKRWRDNGIITDTVKKQILHFKDIGRLLPSED